MLKRSLILLLAACPAIAQIPIIPVAPNNNRYDEFTSGGLRCRNTLGSATTFDTGVIANQPQFGEEQYGVYGRITIPLGKTPSRLNCGRLFDLEMRRLELDIQALENQQYMVPVE